MAMPLSVKLMGVVGVSATAGVITGGVAGHRGTGLGWIAGATGVGTLVASGIAKGPLRYGLMGLGVGLVAGALGGRSAAGEQAQLGVDNVDTPGPLEHVKVIGSRFAPAAPAVTGNNAYSPQPGDLLPDGAQIAPENISIQKEGDKRVLRFDSVVGNVGRGPLHLAFDNRESGGTSDTRQVVVNDKGEYRKVDMNGTFDFDDRAEHQHTHFDDFERYELRRLNADDSVGEQVGENYKASFYIMNVRDLSPQELGRPMSDTDKTLGAVNFSGVQADTQQGISVGSADVYGAGLEGQTLDVSNLKPGKYVLRQIFDPLNRFAESDETNNVHDTQIELS